MTDDIDIIVSGLLCLDILPDMANVPLEALSSPGKLYETGQIILATGGAVSNTGLALYTLGTRVRLLAAVGDDLLGQIILQFLRNLDPALTEMITVQPAQPSSYSVVLSPQNMDRIILHCAGPNDTFNAGNVDESLVKQARIFHFGYPTLMPEMIVNDGASLTELYRKVKAVGVVTSLDTALPDPTQLSGRVNWPIIFKNALPYVDIFIPSLEESVFMLRRADYDAWRGDVLAHIDRDYLRAMADELLAMGAVISGFKLGALGLYLRTGNTGFNRLARLNLNTADWAGIELWQPPFEVDVAGTTGAGDAAYAGFLKSLLLGLSPQQALRMACAVGSCNVEKADATSSIRAWDETRARIAMGWKMSDVRLPGF